MRAGSSPSRSAAWMHSVSAQEDLGEIFQGLQVSLGILREAGDGNRLLALPDEFGRSLVHVSLPGGQRPRTSEF
jgi:hypothetical protein